MRHGLFMAANLATTGRASKNLPGPAGAAPRFNWLHPRGFGKLRGHHTPLIPPSYA